MVVKDGTIAGGFATVPKEVKNRDIIILSRATDQLAELDIIKEKRDMLNERRYSMSQAITGLPGGHQKKGLDDLLSRVDELERELVEKQAELFGCILDAERILKGIQNHSMYAFVSLKYYYQDADAAIQRRLNIPRSQFERMCEVVENAPNMAAVVWPEKYTCVGAETELKRIQEKRSEQERRRG